MMVNDDLWWLMMVNDGPGIFVTSRIGAPSLNLVRLGIMRVARSRKLSWRAAVSWITSLIRFGNGLTWSTSSSIIHMLTYTHIHVSYTYIIYIYHIHIIYHIHLSYTCIMCIYIYVWATVKMVEDYFSVLQEFFVRDVHESDRAPQKR